MHVLAPSPAVKRTGTRSMVYPHSSPPWQFLPLSLELERMTMQLPRQSAKDSVQEIFRECWLVISFLRWAIRIDCVTVCFTPSPPFFNSKKTCYGVLVLSFTCAAAFGRYFTAWCQGSGDDHLAVQPEHEMRPVGGSCKRFCKLIAFFFLFVYPHN